MSIFNELHDPFMNVFRKFKIIICIKKFWFGKLQNIGKISIISKLAIVINASIVEIKINMNKEDLQ